MQGVHRDTHPHLLSGSNRGREDGERALAACMPRLQGRQAEKRRDNLLSSYSIAEWQQAGSWRGGCGTHVRGTVSSVLSHHSEVPSEGN